jgi:hypothetical protein
VDEAAITRYAPQLNLYRHAVAVLTGLPISAIACELVLTRRQLRIAVPSGKK